MRTYSWSAAVVLAVLETNDDKLIDRIRDAEAAISRRIEELDGPPDFEEMDALWQAATSIKALRREIAQQVLR